MIASAAFFGTKPTNSGSDNLKSIMLPFKKNNNKIMPPHEPYVYVVGPDEDIGLVHDAADESEESDGGGATYVRAALFVITLLIRRFVRQFSR
jgi:hypothetical protein